MLQSILIPFYLTPNTSNYILLFLAGCFNALITLLMIFAITWTINKGWHYAN